MAKGKYEIKIIEAKGKCEESLFQKMANRGDITSERVKDVVGKTFELVGYAKCNIETDDKNFDIVYYATKTGYISSGSEVFFDSIKDYYDDAKVFTIREIKTSKGTTYKASPVLVDETKEIYE